ncbi:MAG: hypothetical protein V2B18_09985, partial [Pseudomonadota bacterium]
ILTSSERNDPGGVLSPDSHAGALFRVDGIDLDTAPSPDKPIDLGKPIAEFRAKSEGLALLPDKSFLVVFDDDDGGWKGMFDGYERSDALFTIVKPNQ